MLGSLYYDLVSSTGPLPYAPITGQWTERDIQRLAERPETYDRPVMLRDTVTGRPIMVYGGQVMTQSGPLLPGMPWTAQPTPWYPGLLGVTRSGEVVPWALLGLAGLLLWGLWRSP